MKAPNVILSEKIIQDKNNSIWSLYSNVIISEKIKKFRFSNYSSISTVYDPSIYLLNNTALDQEKYS